MNQQKILTLLFILVVFVNYENYFKPNIQKMYSKINLLENRIFQEKILYKNISQEDLNISVNYKNMMYNGQKYTYSQAMGKFQEDITKATKGFCKVEKILWAQVSTTETWYEKLRINLFLNCSPDALHQTANNLKSQGKLYYSENFLALKLQKKNTLKVKVQLVAFRSLDATK